MSHVFMGHPDLSSRNENLQRNFTDKNPSFPKGLNRFQSPLKGIIAGLQAGVTAQWVKCLPHSPNHLSLDPQNPNKESQLQ